MLASISPHLPGSQESRPGEELDEIDDSNVNSILAVSDDAGNIYAFLDGSYPLGVIELGSACSVLSLHKHENAALFLHAQTRSPTSIQHTATRPTVIQVPFLGPRFYRDLARASSTCRELVWYAMRVVKEMRAAWFGSQTQTGARELGPNWIRTLEQKQREQFGRALLVIFFDPFSSDAHPESVHIEEEPNAILDLTLLLTTGRPSEAVSDFFGSGEQMSERVRTFIFSVKISAQHCMIHRACRSGSQM